MKKAIAMMMTAAIFCALPVSAAPSPSAPVVSASVQESAQETAVRQQAQEAGMTVQEYRNNVLTSTQGVAAKDAVAVGQGGHVVLNGAPSNLTIPISRAKDADVLSAQTNTAAVTAALAQSVASGSMTVVSGESQTAVETTKLSTKLIACVNTSSAVSFKNAGVNYYVKGVKAGQLIKVYVLVNGVWVEQQVTEVRADHVILNQTATGPMAIYTVTLEDVPVLTTAQEAAAFHAASAPAAAE